MLHYLNKPYPFISSGIQVKLSKAIATGLFVVFFLWLFDNREQDSILLFIDNGIVVFISQLFFLLAFHRIFTKAFLNNSIKFWQYISGLSFAVLLGFSLMYLYVTPVYFKTTYSFPAFINYIKENLPFLFPVLLFILAVDYIFVLRDQKSHQVGPILQEPEADILQADSSLSKDLIIETEPGFPVFKVAKASILFIKSADNYIEIYYQSEGRVIKEMIRYQLSAVEANQENKFLSRVHRSWLCNLENVSHVSGGVQNCILHFESSPVLVPVARSRAKDIIQRVLYMKKNEGSSPL